ncbi:MAG: hypothetical protein ACQEQF_12915 [Bacillota bacterium]
MNKMKVKKQLEKNYKNNLSHELLELFETDLEKFISLHNKLKLNFIKNDDKLRKDYHDLMRNFTPDVRLCFLLNLQIRLKRNGIEE